MTVLPKDLTEILGAAPFFHLVPNQDLAPLASMGSLRPQNIDPQSYISAEAAQVVEDLERNHADFSAERNAVLGSFAARFQAFQEPDLERVTFKRPVMAAESGKLAKLGPLSSLYDGFISENDTLPHSAIQDLDADLGGSNMEGERLEILEDITDISKVKNHIEAYRIRLENAQNSGSTKRLGTSDLATTAPKKRQALNKAQFSASREKGLRDTLEELDLEAGYSDSSLHSKYVLLRDGQPTLSRYALTEIRKIFSSPSKESNNLSPDNRLKVQKLCVNTMIKSKTTSAELSIDSIQACTVLLEILNSSLSDRQLHLVSFIEAIIACLALIIDQTKQSTRNLGLNKELLECFDALSTQVKLKAIDEYHITKLEYLCVSSIASKARNEDFSGLKVVFVDLITHIFENYSSQREFIVAEVLANWKDIQAHNSINSTRLSLGTSVSFLCSLLVRLVQSLNLHDSKNEVHAFMDLNLGPTPQNNLHQHRLRLIETLRSRYEETTRIQQQISDFIFNSLPTLDSEAKQNLIGLIKDLVIISPLPEWPGAENMLVAILNKLVTSMTQSNVPQTQEPLILDLAGIFGVEFLKAKKSETTNVQPDTPMAHREVLCHLKISKSSPVVKNLELQFQLMKSINQFGIQISQSELSEPGPLSAYIDELFSILAHEAVVNTSENGGKLSSVARRYYHSILMSSSFSRLYDKFVSLLKMSLDSPRAKVTTKAIKILASLIEVEPKILLETKISQSVSRLLRGKSAMSRDAVIDLLGDYMFTSPRLTKTYYRSIGDMSDDESISVRKRVAKIMHEAYLKVDEISIKVYAFVTLLKRLNDAESSFADATRNHLLSLIFSCPNSEINSEVLSQSLKEGGQVRTLLRNFIDDALAGDLKGTRYTAIKEIVMFILDEALVADESSLRQTNALHLVDVLVQCDQTLISQDQLVSLQPFLLINASSECYYALRILRLAVTKSRVMRPNFSTQILEILFKRLAKFDNKELNEAVQIINLLTTASDNLGLAKATISSMKLLWPHVSRGRPVGDIEQAKAIKLLQLLGCFGSHCDFEKYIEVFTKSDIGLKPNETIVSLITRYLIFFCQPETPIKVRACAEKNLISVASYKPRIFLSETVLKTLDHDLRSGPGLIKLAIVSGLTRYLSKESEKDEKNPIQISDVSEKSRNRFLGIEQHSLSDGVCAGVAQRYTPAILALSVTNADEFGELCVSFVQLVMKLGYANPKVCVPTIIALQASPNSKIRRIGAELHQDIFDKHESLADRSYAEAVSLAAKYVHQTGNIQQMNTCLESLYGAIKRTYSARKKFILSLAKLFSLDVSVQTLQNAIDQRNTTVFLALNLSKLRFDSSEEVFLIIYHLDRSITREGLDVSEKITSTIGSQAGEGMSITNLQLLFVYSQSVLALIYLRQTLASAYGVAAIAMESFRPSRPDPELRQQPKLVYLLDYPLANLDLDTKLTNPAAFGPLFTRMVQNAREYTT